MTGRIVQTPILRKDCARHVLRLWPRTFAAALQLACVALLACGCVVLPIPTDEDKVLEGRPVSEFQQSFIRPGETTREDVLRHLGQPYIIWEDARVYVYRWDMRQGIFVWVVFGSRDIGGDAHDVPKHYLLLVQFDGDNVVSRVERTTRPLSRSATDFLMDWAYGRHDRSANRRTED
jgi:outer membrane protein assembly factor BamE (lipoprotein component of BamABCDE complex)